MALTHVIPYLKFWFRSGNAHSVHSPFVYQLLTEVIYGEDTFYNLEKLKIKRNLLELDNRTVQVLNVGAPSKAFSSFSRRVGDIVRKGNSSHKQASLLFKLVNHFQSKKILELGTSIGLSALYLASANRQAEVDTIEASPDLCRLAKELAREEEVNNIHFHQGLFDDVLPELLKKKEAERYDFIYVDGNHTYEATLRYMNMFKAVFHSDLVIVLDDIYWTPMMQKAWNEIRNWPEVKTSLDLFYFGILFFRKEAKEKEHFSLRW